MYTSPGQISAVAFPLTPARSTTESLREGGVHATWYALGSLEEDNYLINLAKAGPGPVRPRLDRGARIKFWGVLNVLLRACGAQLC